MHKLLPLLAALALVGCNGLSITRPGAENDVVVPDAEGRVTIEVSSFGWELSPAGACDGRENCGHLVARLTEDEQTGEHSWNGMRCGEGDLEVEGTTFTVDLTTCTRRTGLFSVMVGLHDDDHVSYEGGGVAAFRRFIVED